MRGMPLEDVKTVVKLNSPLAATLRDLKGTNVRVKASGSLIPFPALAKLNRVLSTNGYVSAAPMNLCCSHRPPMFPGTAVRTYSVAKNLPLASYNPR
jgi:hypothetical protein